MLMWLVTVIREKLNCKVTIGKCNLSLLTPKQLNAQSIAHFLVQSLVFLTEFGQFC